MIKNGVHIEQTFAEAFPMKATRLVITAIDDTWAGHAARTMTGFATSVIACGVEAGIEGDKPVPLGNRLRYFGDGYQIAKVIAGRRYWRVPVMDGEFLCEGQTARVDAVGGGNFLVVAASQRAALHACTMAAEAIAKLPNVIAPFPGGIVRSGSKVGSRYKGLIASTNDAYCPTLRGLVDSKLGPEAGAVLEIVIDGLTPEDVSLAMRHGIEAVCAVGAAAGIQQVTAGNYGGKLGPHHFHLHEVMA